MHIDRRDARNVHAAMFAMRLAAGEHGCFAYDSAFPDIQDEEGFRREAEQARQLGYVGKSCVHPKQVALANEIFSADELSLTTRAASSRPPSWPPARGAAPFCSTDG